MTNDYKELLTKLFGKFEGYKRERRSAGSVYRLMGLVADTTELAATLETEVLERVKQEAMLDVDADIDFGEMSEQVLTMELTEEADTDEMMREQMRLANEALSELSHVLSQISDQLERHHSDEEYVRLYEQEKRRYLSSGSAQRSRQTYGEWKEHVCFGAPSLEDIEDYRLEKVAHLFEKGVFSAKVKHIQRAKRYAGELDFEQLDDDHKLRKTIYKHYAALRKLVDWQDGCLVVNPARVGQHFFASRHEEKAKSNRSNFLKYMHKIDLVQQERQKLLAAQQESEDSSLLPDVLATGMAMKYWKRLQKAGFVDEHYQLSAPTTRKQAMYIADVFSDKLQMRSKWKPFQELWHINNLAQEKWEMQETGKTPAHSEEIDKIFKD